MVAVLTDRAHSAELTVFLGAVELQAVLGLDRRELLRTLSDPSEFAGWMNVLIQRLSAHSDRFSPSKVKGYYKIPVLLVHVPNQALQRFCRLFESNGYFPAARHANPVDFPALWAEMFFF